MNKNHPRKMVVHIEVHFRVFTLEQIYMGDFKLGHMVIRSNEVISAVEDFFENQDESFFTMGMQVL